MIGSPTMKRVQAIGLLLAFVGCSDSSGTTALFAVEIAEVWDALLSHLGKL